MQALFCYNVYHLTVWERAGYALLGAGGAAALAFLFFRRLEAVFILAPLGAWLCPASMRRRLAAKRQETLLLQWKEAILSIGTALSAGYSVENAFIQTCQELQQRFGEKQIITKEFTYIVHQIHMNVPIEKTIGDFADRSGLDEIKSFAEIFQVSKRAGSDLVRIIGEAVEIIAARVEVKEEIITFMTSVRLEGRIMNVIPLGILAYIHGTSPGFFQPMYDTAAGQLIMAVCFAAYLGICRYSAKLMEVEL